MLFNRPSSEVIAEFRKRFEAIAPGTDSITVARDLWESWEKSGVTPPDLNTIAADYAKHENGFFYEIVRLAERTGGKQLNIHLCQFSLDQYNAYAFTASDGYIVLADDVLFQILYFLCNIIVFDAMGLIKEEEERAALKTLAARIIHTNYLSRERIDFSKEPLLHDLLKKDYEIAEFANYFFSAFKAFIIAHEIGHHILGHTTGSTRKIFSVMNKTVEAEVDLRSLSMEYDADSYGYNLFHTLCHTTDDSVYYAFCKYRFVFAPFLLFQLFDRLDRLVEQQENSTITYTDHPHPLDRAAALEKQFVTDLQDDLYLSFKKSISYFLG
jgi:hypothetical protein